MQQRFKSFNKSSLVCVQNGGRKRFVPRAGGPANGNDDDESETSSEAEHDDEPDPGPASMSGQEEDVDTDEMSATEQRPISPSKLLLSA